MAYTARGSSHSFNSVEFALVRFSSRQGEPIGVGFYVGARQVLTCAHVAAESLSRLNRSAALDRALAALTELIGDVEQSCPYPEWPLAEGIAEQWRDVLAKAAGEIGDLAITRPVANPFVVGNPVTGQVFVGWGEVFRRLEELWGSDPAQIVPSVVLFGHRRMGKSSILQNLGQHRFGVGVAVAYLTMQRAGKLAHTGQLLGALALGLYDALRAHGAALAEPNLADFAGQGYTAFNHFLRAARPAVAGRRVILAIDEFELIEDAITKGQVDAELLGFLRGVIHSEPWLVMALAGLHTLEEMTADYWNPLFASLTPVRVSFLSPGASAELLANPSADFPLDFTRVAAERVYALVRGQPYLTQLIGHTLVQLYNQSVFEDRHPREPHITLEDVDEVVSRAEFYEQGSYYFTGVWSQAQVGNSGPNGQVALLLVLAAEAGASSANALFARAGLEAELGRASLQTLLQHDVLMKIDPGLPMHVPTPFGEPIYDFAVPLMRRWIRDYKRLGLGA